MVADASEVFWYRAVVRPSGIWLPVLCIPLAAACRLGFDRNAAQDSGSEMPPDAAPPKVLSCGSPPAFPIKIATGSGSANVDTQVNGFVAVATDDGYYAFVLDLANVVHGFAYKFAGDQLVPRTENAVVRSDPTQAISVADTGEGILLAAWYQQPSDGTALVPLTADLTPRGTPYLSANWYTIDHALARSSDGTIALGGHPTAPQAVIERVSSLGVPGGSPHEAVAPSENATTMVIVPAGQHFLVAWQVNAEIAGLRARVLDTAFQQTVTTTTLNPDQKGNNPAVAYAPSVDRYLFSWFFKEANGANDDLWINLRNGNLEELSRAQLSRTGVDPRVAAGTDKFLVVWRDDAIASGLSAATASSSDATKFTPRPVLSHTGSVLGWDVVSRAGQPALAWLESTDTPGTATLRFDPLCDD